MNLHDSIRSLSLFSSSFPSSFPTFLDTRFELRRMASQTLPLIANLLELASPGLLNETRQAALTITAASGRASGATAGGMGMGSADLSMAMTLPYARIVAEWVAAAIQPMTATKASLSTSEAAAAVDGKVASGSARLSASSTDCGTHATQQDPDEPDDVDDFDD